MPVDEAKKTLLIDLDSTAVDYMGGMIPQLNEIRSPGEPLLKYGDELHDVEEYLYKRRKLIQRTPGFWRNLKPNEMGFDVLHMGTKIGFIPHILTKAPADCPNSWSEKLEWRNEHLPNVKLTVSEDKSLVYGRVLVEDWPDFYMPWLAHRPRGLVVLIDHPWNRETKHEQIVRYTGKNKDEVYEALLKAYNR